MQSLVLNYLKLLFANILNFMDRFSSYYEQGLQGGALPADAPTYIFRDADREVYNFVRESDRQICYIFAAPQMGKSSLMVRTVKRLADRGAICIQISQPMSVETISEEALYLSILRSIYQRLNHRVNNLTKVDELWQKYQNFPASRRFLEFIKSLANKSENKQIVIFIDDIQTLIEWQLHHSLLAAIRTLSQSDEELVKRLKFVFLGVAKPEELFPDDSYTFASTKLIELGYLQGDCQPLLAGLTKVSNNPAELLPEILFWTGGQPFLTQFLCDLLAKQDKVKIDTSVKSQIAELVKGEMIGNWRSQEGLISHFQAIENWFIKDRDHPKSIEEKVYALTLYSRLLSKRNQVKFSEDSQKQSFLLRSGLVAKFGELIDIANPIYREILNRKWVGEIKQIIVKQRMENMPIQQVFNRDVFMLIDRSGSMTTKDASTGGKTRWEYLQETVQGHVFEILNEQDNDYGIICNEVTLYFFNANRPPAKTIHLRDAAQVESAFKENKPSGSTFISPTLNEAINQWFSNRTNDKGALVVIYTDGQLDDRNEFVKAISDTCSRINSEEEIKILLIGIGSDINPEFYLDIDLNVSNFTSRRGEHCNIFIFDLIDDVMEEGIIAAFERQLEGDPKKGLAPWIKERYPEWYKKRFGA